MTDDERAARIAQYLSGYGRKVEPEQLAALDPNDPNAHLAKYISGYGRLVVTSERGKRRKRMPRGLTFPTAMHKGESGRMRTW